MKTIRLLYPDHISGGLDTYYFGAQLLQYILPANSDQPVVQVEIKAPDVANPILQHGIVGLELVLEGIRDARTKLYAQKPDRVITIGGNCLVSLAPFDYLHGLYPNTGIVWIDAHPDVSTVKDGYPRAHAMVLGSLLGGGAQELAAELKNSVFKGSDILYIGLQPLHSYQEEYLKAAQVDFTVQDKAFVSHDVIKNFVQRFEHILVHFDIDVLDEHLFHSTYFANPELSGDGSGGGKMNYEQLASLFKLLEENADIVGFTIAEYLPFDEHKLHKIFCDLQILTTCS